LFRSLCKSFQYAFSGLWYCIRTQRNFRIHMVFALTVLLVSGGYRLTRAESICLLLTIALVMLLEMVNTAIEKTVDAGCEGYNEHAKIAKDVAAGAVLISAMFSVAVAAVLFLRQAELCALIGYIVAHPWMWGAIALYVVGCAWFIRGKKVEQ